MGVRPCAATGVDSGPRSCETAEAYLRGSRRRVSAGEDARAVRTRTAATHGRGAFYRGAGLRCPRGDPRRLVGTRTLCQLMVKRPLMPLTVGTAGHIDHGKTWLVRALTGKDTDRLPEEQRRGISIDLGYAPLELADGRRLSVIDVPGHERFVRTMVAGATGIDLFLLVIDAGEGARPQTHEHLAILRLLGIEHGVVALTKVDAVDDETVDLAGGGPRARTWRRGRGSEREDRRGARRAARRARPVADRRACSRGPADAAVRRPLVLLPGSARSSPGRCGRARSARATSSGSSRGPRRARPQRPGARSRRRAGGAGTARRGQPSGGRAAEVGEEKRSSRRRVPRLVSPRCRPRGARAHRGRRPSAGAPRYGTHPRAGRARSATLRPAPARRPVVAARGDRVILRGETTLGGGTVLDPRRPGTATRRAWSCSSEATSPRRSRARPSSTRCASSLDGELDGRRACRAVGVLGGVAADLEDDLARASRRPTRSTRASRSRRSRGRRRWFRSCRSSGVDRSSTCRARCRRSAVAVRRRPQLEASWQPRASERRRWTTTSSRASSRRGASRPPGRRLCVGAARSRWRRTCC